jgi:Fur family ferric uptake transcriptional regulator
MNRKMNSQEWAREKIRSAGLRATPARIATLKVLHGSGSPLTHAEVSDKLENLEIDKATVFRNLTDLVARNVIRRSALGDNVWRFEIIKESAHEPDSHPHFICIDCGSVSCMEDVELKRTSTSKSPLFERITEIVLRGHCNECA